ncbi:ornithine cyclodeaminase family protein [Pelagovum pacificum]|uniref:Ornithine cyclodeaminase n=1 Tax=Pelagovum pacificum TaxID=2588711 RepID=A0A5C5GHJ6_9RHOB|nr:ornithine cyclodeaminase [Pelagovum pacificum]QQA42676.1 ornithine cyclodeaminase [Pelagovum pacificum]TNY34173.1 ornithine cyclodeaminase [Pelagovum pacificum]
MSRVISFDEGDRALDWLALTDALAAGHKLPRAEIEDVFLYRDPDTLLNRSAWIEGLGLLVKCATIFPGNPAKGTPMINGAVNLFSDGDGTLLAVVDFHLVTKWKTAGDSLLAARRLAPPKVADILIVGAGTVGHSLRAAYGAAFPDARFTVWNRTSDKAEAFAAEHDDTHAVTDLADAVHAADIVTSATMSSEPIIKGEWLRPGQHLDLIGAYRPDMREADDAALTRARIFVDSRETVVSHIGELKDPIARGVIADGDVVADYYELDNFRRDPDDITLFKNGGGAHLDLMTARHILDSVG